MWPVDLYSVIGVVALETGAPFAVSGIGLETYQGLGALERAGIQFGATFVVAMVAIGLLQGFSPRTVTKARRSPVISICIGLPGLLVVTGLTSTGYLIVGTSLGTFFGIPLVAFGATILPVLTVLGFVAIGRTIAARLGRNQLWAGVLVGSVLSGLVGLSLALTLVTAILAGALGIGAGVRVMMGAGGTTQPDERTVPPANKI